MLGAVESERAASGGAGIATGRIPRTIPQHRRLEEVQTVLCSMEYATRN